MNDKTFWATVWAVILMGAISTGYFTSHYWIDHNAKIVNLIENGVDPIAAMCAMQNDYGNLPVCLVLAAKK